MNENTKLFVGLGVYLGVAGIGMHLYLKYIVSKEEKRVNQLWSNLKQRQEKIGELIEQAKKMQARVESRNLALLSYEKQLSEAALSWRLDMYNLAQTSEKKEVLEIELLKVAKQLKECEDIAAQL